MPRFYSNHLTCSALNTFTLENFINLKLVRFLFWLKKCKSPCFDPFRFYFLDNSIFMKNARDIWWKKYGVVDILCNDFDALVSRVGYEQDREYSSMFVGFLTSSM